MVREFWQGLAVFDSKWGDQYYPAKGHRTLQVGDDSTSIAPCQLGWEMVRGTWRPSLLSALLGSAGFYTHKMQMSDQLLEQLQVPRYAVMLSVQRGKLCEYPVFINGQRDQKGFVPLVIPTSKDVLFVDGSHAKRCPCNARAIFPEDLVRTYTRDEVEIDDWRSWFLSRF